MRSTPGRHLPHQPPHNGARYDRFDNIKKLSGIAPLRGPFNKEHAMSVTQLRPRKPVPAINQVEISALRDLEAPIRDLERAAQIAFLMTTHDLELDDDPEDERLGLFAVEQVERHAAELRKQFYAAFEGNAVQS